jgi:hypothetical protein
MFYEPHKSRKVAAHIRWSTALAVVGVAVVAAVVSYEHASDLVREHGESGGPGD